MANGMIIRMKWHQSPGANKALQELKEPAPLLSGVSTVHHPNSFPSTSTTTSFVTTQTMQAAVHQLPLQSLPQYNRQSLNGINAILNPIPSGPLVIPTPSVATRKRKRPYQYTVSYSEVQEVDNEGRLREVIVIEDTPPPLTISPATTNHNGYSASYQPPIYSAPIRTRARAAAEAQALSASGSAAIVGPVAKRRRKDLADEELTTTTKKLIKAPHPSSTLPTTKSWASGSGAAVDNVRVLPLRDYVQHLTIPCKQTSKGPVPWDDKEGHYIVVPDDIIHGHCKYCNVTVFTHDLSIPSSFQIAQYDCLDKEHSAK
jgi:dual-specificity kinase